MGDEFLEVHVDEAEANSFTVNYVRKPFVSGMECNVAGCGETVDSDGAPSMITYSTYREYMTHWNDVHVPHITLHVCRVCGVKYRFKTRLTSHLKSVHRFKTTDKLKEYSRKTELKDNEQYSALGEEIFARRPTMEEIEIRRQQESDRRRVVARETGITMRIPGEEVYNSRDFRFEISVKENQCRTFIRQKRTKKFEPYKAPRDFE